AVAILDGFHLGELAVDVLPADLGRRCRRPRSQPTPRAYTYVYAALDGFVTQVAAPHPGQDRHLSWAFAAIPAQHFRATKDQRADVAGGLPVVLYRVDNGLRNVVIRPGNIDAPDLAAIDQPFYVRAKPENGRPVGCLVGTDAL